VADQIAAFTSAVGSILSLDPNAIRQLQTAPYALSLAIWILLLGTLSDVLGDSPLLFVKKIRPSRFAAALAIEAALSILRLAIWFLSFWFLIDALHLGTVSLSNVVLVVGLGYAPMLLSFLVLIPYLGPVIGRILHAWTLVTILASIAVALNSSPWQVLAPGVVAVVLILLVRRFSDRVSVAVLGRISRRLVGADVMQRTRAMDPRLVMSGRSA
jgi:hypothetical protein